MRTLRLAVAVAIMACPVSALVTRADTVELPTPEAAKVQESKLLLAVQKANNAFRPDRLKPSVVPGTVRNDEKLLVGLGGDGTVRTVVMEQRLDVQGEGDYAIRERGPAREATTLGTERPPLTQKGAVVWQGFTPGHRALAARLRLDPALEAEHLPMTVAVTFTDASGRKGRLGDGGRIPGAGTVHVTVTNATEQPQDLPTGSDASAADLAGPLDLALRVARSPSADRLPSTDAGLPAELAVTGAAQVPASQGVPLHLTGSLTVTGTTATLTGPATTSTATGGSFDGTLGGSLPGRQDASVTFDVKAAGPGELALTLDAVATFNRQELAPPGSFLTWREWAASKPPAGSRKEALDLLVAVAASGARASSYSPYLGADLEGTGSTSYALSFAPPSAIVRAKPVLHPQWGAISLVGVGGLALLGAGYSVWRRS
ncbi:MAG: hypothetical protein JWO22_3491 [Frankiales bacterium]|nr:hypothetical protein [Frankiales bacterium]